MELLEGCWEPDQTQIIERFMELQGTPEVFKRFFKNTQMKAYVTIHGGLFKIVANGIGHQTMNLDGGRHTYLPLPTWRHVGVGHYQCVDKGPGHMRIECYMPPLHDLVVHLVDQVDVNTLRWQIWKGDDHLECLMARTEPQAPTRRRNGNAACASVAVFDGGRHEVNEGPLDLVRLRDGLEPAADLPGMQATLMPTGRSLSVQSPGGHDGAFGLLPDGPRTAPGRLAPSAGPWQGGPPRGAPRSSSRGSAQSRSVSGSSLGSRGSNVSASSRGSIPESASATSDTSGNGQACGRPGRGCGGTGGPLMHRIRNCIRNM